MTRLEYLRETYMPDVIYEVYEHIDYTEVRARNGGDMLIYRIRGNDKDGFMVTVR
jgi:hypothetical protein